MSLFHFLGLASGYSSLGDSKSTGRDARSYTHISSPCLHLVYLPSSWPKHSQWPSLKTRGREIYPWNIAHRGGGVGGDEYFWRIICYFLYKDTRLVSDIFELLLLNSITLPGSSFPSFPLCNENSDFLKRQSYKMNSRELSYLFLYWPSLWNTQTVVPHSVCVRQRAQWWRWSVLRKTWPANPRFVRKGCQQLKFSLSITQWLSVPDDSPEAVNGLTCHCQKEIFIESVWPVFWARWLSS